MYQLLSQIGNRKFFQFVLTLALVCAGCTEGSNSAKPKKNFIISPAGKVEGAGQFFQFSADSLYLHSPIGTYDIKNGKMVGRNRESDEFVLRLAVSPDGSRVATGGRSGMLRVFSITDWVELHQIEAHSGAIVGLSFVDEGEVLISVGTDGYLRRWDCATGQQVLDGGLRVIAGEAQSNAEQASVTISKSISFDSNSFLSMVVSHDTSLMALSYKSGEKIDIRSTSDSMLVNQLTTKGDWGSLATFSHDNSLLLVLSETGIRAVKLSDHGYSEEFTTLTRTGANSAAFSPDGRTLALGYINRENQNGIVELINWGDRSRRGMFVGHVVQCFSLQFSPDGKFLATSGRGRGIGEIDVHLWQVDSLQDVLFKGLPPLHR